jgi:hypothetical protein
MRIEVAIVNEASPSVCSDDEVAAITQALQRQVDHDFRPTWGIAAKLTAVPKGQDPPASAWVLGVFDDSDQAGALGYHDLTPELHPVSKAFAGTDRKYGASVSVTCSHELLEMLGDPYINTSSLDPRTGRLYAYENADAVEADELGYEIEGVVVSDFVLPQFFDPQHAGKGRPLSFKGNVTEPFSPAKGGYLSYLDLNDLEKGWQQVTAEGAPDSGREAGQRSIDVVAGSRRHRRIKAFGDELQVSTFAVAG